MKNRLMKHSQVGATLAEFTLFLPIWAICIVGLINLGLAGRDSTAVQLTAVKGLWSQAIPLTTMAPNDPRGAHHAMPSLAAAHKVANLGLLAANTDNDQRFVDGEEAAAHGVGLGRGHWGDGHSAVRTRNVPVAAYLKTRPVHATSDAESILGSSQDRKVVHVMLNDGLEQAVEPSGSAAQIVGSALAGVGLVTAVGAGVRYGDVYSDETREISLLASAPTITANVHYDLLVAPQAVSPAQFDTVSTGIAWLSTQTVDHYRVMARFGKSEF